MQLPRGAHLPAVVVARDVGEVRPQLVKDERPGRARVVRVGERRDEDHVPVVVARDVGHVALEEAQHELALLRGAVGEAERGGARALA